MDPIAPVIGILQSLGLRAVTDWWQARKPVVVRLAGNISTVSCGTDKVILVPVRLAKQGERQKAVVESQLELRPFQGMGEVKVSARRATQRAPGGPKYLEGSYVRLPADAIWPPINFGSDLILEGTLAFMVPQVDTLPGRPAILRIRDSDKRGSGLELTLPGTLPSVAVYAGRGPSPNRIEHDGVMWEDRGRGMWGVGLIVEGPLCPHDLTPLGHVGHGLYARYVAKARDDNWVSDYHGHLQCGECGQKFTFGKEYKTVKEARAEAEARLEGLRKRQGSGLSGMGRHD